MSRSIYVAAALVLLAACTTGETSDGTTSTTAAPVTTVPEQPSSGPPPTTAPDQTPTTEPPVTDQGPEEEADPADPLVQAVDAFQVWVGHLAEGNHQEAWDAMAPTSQAALGEELFFDSMVYSMAEGWGSWSVAEDVLYQLDEDEAGRTLLWVSGTISPRACPRSGRWLFP